MTTETNVVDMQDIETPVEDVIAELTELEIAQQDAADWKHKALVLAADMENLRKRTARDLDDARKFAITNFAKEILPIADNLERAMEAIEAQEGVDTSLLEGVKMVQGQVSAVFDKLGIARVSALGEQLNADVHQVMVEMPSQEPAGTVVQEMQAGYTLNGRLLRPALVGTAKAE